MNRGQYTSIISTMLFAINILLSSGCAPKADVSPVESSLPDETPATETIASTPSDDTQEESPSPAPPNALTEAESRGELAKLSPEQTSKLLELDSTSPNFQIERQAVIVPSYIPKDFKVVEFITSESGEDQIYTYYMITYAGQNNSCFSIRQIALDGGTGEGFFEAENIENVEIPELDISVDIGYINLWRDASSSFMIVDLSGQDEHDGYDGVNYVFTSGGVAEIGCDLSIEPQEFVKVIQSLQYLDPNESREIKVEDNVELQCYPQC